jgi:hypothetical protein
MKRLAAEAGFNLVDGSFEEGAVISGWPDVVWSQTDGKYYQWYLDEAKTIAAGSTPATSGGIGAGAWVDRTDVTLRSELSSAFGVSLVGGAGVRIKTSQAGGLSSALDYVIANGGTVDVDVDETITSISKILSGKDIAIVSSGGTITITPNIGGYRVGLTLTGTGVERVFNGMRIKSTKTRGDGCVVVGFVGNNYAEHRDSSTAEKLSAAVNTVSVRRVLACYHSYTDMWQQLSTDVLHAGAYGYGIVPLDADFVAVWGGVLGTYESPIDRHSVYASSFEDGTGYCKSVHVFDNSIRQRVYNGSTNVPETGFEFAIKCVGTRNTVIHDNDIDGGVGVSLTTFRAGQYADRLSIHDNHGRTYSYGYLVSKQDESTPDGWYISRIHDSDNDLILTSNNARAGVAENVANWDSHSKYTSSVLADATWSNKAHAFEHKNSATATCVMDIDRSKLSGFKFIAKVSNVSSLSGKIKAVDYYASVAPVTKVTAVSAVNIELTANSMYTSWKAYGVSTNLTGISYWDSTFGLIKCTDGSVPSWTKYDGTLVANTLANRPWPVYQGQRYWETDQNRFVVWTGSKWVTSITTYPPVSAATATILTIGATVCDSGHMIYNTTTKKPCWFDASASAWKYADGVVVS